MAQPPTSGTSSRRHTKDHEVNTNPRLPHYGDSEWETKEVNVYDYTLIRGL